MTYETMGDMFLDNRRGLEKQLANADEAVRKAALDAYDWAAIRGIENNAGSKVEREKAIEVIGKEKWHEIEMAACQNIMEIEEAAAKYRNDVRSGRCVGYSEIVASQDADMTFSTALDLLKMGCKVTRDGWNGRDMFLLYVPSEKWGIIDKIGLGIPKGNLLPWIGIKTADGKFVPWTASQTDLLADDWMIVVK